MNSSVLSLLYDPTLIFVHHITLLFKNAEFPSLCADFCSCLNICLKTPDLFFFILIVILKNIQEERADILSIQHMKVDIYHYLDKNIKYVIPYRCLILALGNSLTNPTKNTGILRVRGEDVYLQGNLRSW